MRRLLPVLLVAVLIAPPAQASPAGPVVLRAAITRAVDSVNPFLAAELAATEMGRLNYEYLTSYSASDFTVSPGLAESWTSTPDGTWTFTIRDGARWSDGAPITAKDIAYTYNLMLTNAAAGTANGSYVENFESVRAVDARQVVIKTKAPQATMLALDVPIVPEHVWSRVPDVEKFTNDTAPVVGSGPFVLTEYRPREYARFRANEHFWRGRPKIDELLFVFYQNTDAAVQALRDGAVDLIGDGVNGALTPAQFGALRDAPGVTVNRAKGKRIYELTMNPGAAATDGAGIGDGHPALRDTRVRQAIGHAIDPKALVDKVVEGYGTPGTGYVPAAFAHLHWTPPDQQRRGFDPAEANRILDEAGYPRAADGVRRDPTGRPLAFRLSGRTDRVADTKVAAFVKEWLRDIGITVEPRIISGSEHNTLVSTGRFDLAFSGWGVSPDPNYVLSVQTCGARPAPARKDGTTDTFFCDTEYDRIYAAQLSEMDRDRRVDLIKQAQRRLYEMAPVIVLYNADSLEAYRGDRFEPFQLQPGSGGTIAGQSGYWGYASATPKASSGAAESGLSPWAIAGLGVAALVVIVGAVSVVRRRRASADSRE